MNKQELIERIEGLKNLFGNKSEYIEIDMVIRLISELDEPQKPVVPQFVADWIEKVGGNLFGLNYDMVPEEIYDWVNEEKGNFKKLHLACAIGYEVEKEKRYQVEVKGVIEYAKCLKYGEGCRGWIFGMDNNFGNTRNAHTRKELEQAGFGWVFDCEGIEIEEVEG